MELFVFAVIFLAWWLGAWAAGSVLVLLLGLLLGAERGVRFGIKGLKLLAWQIGILAILYGALLLFTR